MGATWKRAMRTRNVAGWRSRAYPAVWAAAVALLGAVLIGAALRERSLAGGALVFLTLAGASAILVSATRYVAWPAHPRAAHPRASEREDN